MERVAGAEDAGGVDPFCEDEVGGFEGGCGCGCGGGEGDGGFLRRR